MLDVTLTVTLIFRAPLLTKSTAAGAYGFDAAFARDENGRLVYPKTLVKGRIRQSLIELEDLGALVSADWSGLTGDEARPGTLEPNRASVTFGPFVCADPDFGSGRSYRIQMNSELGSVKENQLLVFESPFAPGQEVRFTGTVHFFAKDDTDATRTADILKMGFRFLTSLGAQRSIGFGEIIGVEVTENRRQMVVAGSSAAIGSGTSLQLILRPELPFCLTTGQVSENSFESDRIISGGALKGALAATWLAFSGSSERLVSKSDESLKDFPALREHFASIRFSHAFPAEGNKKVRAMAIPYSLAEIEREGLKDLVAVKEPEIQNGCAPAFCVDWKPSVWGNAESQFGWPSLGRMLEVRNQHDRGRRRAKDENLFAYEMIVPNGHEWLSTVDFSDITDQSQQDAARTDLERLLATIGRIRFLGKTKAPVKVEIGSFKEIAYSPPGLGGKVAVYLQTPALLCSTKGLDETSGADELFSAYKSYWTKLGLNLSHFFARQQLAGGRYIHSRFGAGDYRPYLITEAGSVFVFEDSDISKIKSRVAKGLPVHEDYSEDWKENPYVPANGFGEFRLFGGSEEGGNV